MEWETVIGLEIHAQLNTRSKIFSGSATAYGAQANTQASAVDLGLPGVLPVLNKEVVRMAVSFGLAINASVSKHCVFARKNYFYPDLPKGYQISQFELPIVEGGAVDIELEDGATKRIALTRAHLEEDAGKSLHEEFQHATGIDLNRAGTPLLEIVSEPQMRSAKEAIAYMKKIHALVRYLDISDGNMQEGSFRCDANVSVRPKGASELGTRTELKNLNSFRFIEKAIDYEVERHIDVLEAGEEIVQETRLYDPDQNTTRAMRSKEEANDYRYFPDPDLLPVVLDDAYIESVASQLPELPDAKRQRFAQEYELSDYDAGVLTATREFSEYFESVLDAFDKDPKLVANWVMGELTAALNKHDLPMTQVPVSPQRLGALLTRIHDNTISGKIAKDVFYEMWQSDQDPDDIIENQGLKQITDSSAIEAIVDQVLVDNPGQLEEFRAGKTKLLGFFVGQVMQRTQGKANPGQVNQVLKQKLQNDD